MNYDFLTPAGSQFPKLVWENSNPSGSFPAQDVNLDLSPYKAVILLYSTNSDTQTSLRGIGYSSVFAPIGVICCMNFAFAGGSGPGAYNRLFLASADKVTFSECRVSYGSSLKAENNSCGIPYRIYGLK